MFDIQKVLASNYLLAKVKDEFKDEASKIIDEVFKVQKAGTLDLEFANSKKEEFLKFVKDNAKEELSKTFNDYLSKLKLS